MKTRLCVWMGTLLIVIATFTAVEKGAQSNRYSVMRLADNGTKSVKTVFPVSHRTPFWNQFQW